MRAFGYLFALVLLLLIGSAASAQDPPKGFLGIELKDITKEEADALGWEASRGIKVVKPNDAAANAGILPGDLILSIDGVEVENMQRFVAAIGDRGAGTRVRLRVLRSGKEQTVSVTLGQRPPALAQPAAVNKDLPQAGGAAQGPHRCRREPGVLPGQQAADLRGWVRDPVAILWDVGSRQSVRRLVGHKSEIYSVAFSPDGARAVTGSYDPSVKIWSLADGNEIATLPHKAKVFCVAISPVDGMIASGSNNGDLRLWDGRTGAPIRTWTQPGSNPASLTFSPDRKHLLSGSGSYATDHVVHVWDVATGKQILAYAKHDNIVVARPSLPMASSPRRAASMAMYKFGICRRAQQSGC
jgi:hypothetical protein